MTHPTNDAETLKMHANIDNLLHNSFRNVQDDEIRNEGVREEASEDDKEFFKISGGREIKVVYEM